MVERQSLNRLAETGARPSRIVRPGSGQVRSPRGLESFRATADSSEERRNHRGDDCATQAEPAGAGRQDGQRIEGVPNHGTTRASRPMRSRGSYQVFGTDSLIDRPQGARGLHLGRGRSGYLCSCAEPPHPRCVARRPGVSPKGVRISCGRVRGARSPHAVPTKQERLLRPERTHRRASDRALPR